MQINKNTCSICKRIGRKWFNHAYISHVGGKKTCREMKDYDLSVKNLYSKIQTIHMWKSLHKNIYRLSLTVVIIPLLFTVNLMKSCSDNFLISCPTVSTRMTLDFNTVFGSFCDYGQKRDQDFFWGGVGIMNRPLEVHAM